MAKIIAGNDGCTSLDVGGRVVRRRKGGFQVPDRHAKRLAEAIGGAVCGVRIDTGQPSEVPGPWCEHGKRPFYCPDCKE